jgi:hypothetical protein
MIIKVFMQKNYDSNIQKIRKHLNADRCIHAFNILYDEGDFFLVSATIEILLGENRKLVISRVDENLKGNDMRIERIGKYKFWGFKSSNALMSYLHKDIIEAELSIKLETVFDIIQNYEKIYSFVETLDDINSEEYQKYRKKDFNWPWGKHDFKFRVFKRKREEIIIFRGLASP